MTQNQDRNEDRLDGPQKSISFATRTSPMSSMPTTTTDDEIVAELDEPPEKENRLRIKTDFHRSTIKPNNSCKPSLLTRALRSSPDSETFRPRIQVTKNVERPRSTNSNTSSASSMELTSDGDLTSPARTTTPSPPFPSTFRNHITSLNLGSKRNPQILQPAVKPGLQDIRKTMVTKPAASNISTKAEPTVETLTKKRCITFACGGQKPKPSTTSAPILEKPRSTVSENTKLEPQKRTCSIKFACSAAVKKQVVEISQPVKPAEVPSRQNSQSPTAIRKIRPAYSPRPPHTRRSSHSPLATKRKRPTFLTSTTSTEATRFHEFASEVVEEDDWICRDACDNKTKITINDTLKKENAIRQLGREAEEEAMQEEEDGEQDEDEDEDDQQEDSDGDDQDDCSDDASDLDVSDGNETDNEAGFAESDDESEGEEFQFWTPGRAVTENVTGEASTYRASAHRTTSESSIDSPRNMSPPAPWSDAAFPKSNPRPARRNKFRPGTPDLPDSTDFVCGTLDEDRPLEEAYLSCMEVRKRERHRAIPQDIDPSFPTSDPENNYDEDEEDEVRRNDSDEPVWMHGKFEESDEHDHAFRRPRARKSPLHSPKRMHSPPPPKPRLRSPPPRRLFGGTSPRRLRSPPLAHQVSPTTSPASHTTSGAITFTPLGQRPGLTHTKSLPRAPNAFCKQYQAIRLATANEDIAEDETTDGYTRGAIDIVKGLERKRQHRKEKLLRKQTNRARKIGVERKPQPGKGAERMRELGLHMAGKGITNRAEYVLSI